MMYRYCILLHFQDDVHRNSERHVVPEFFVPYIEAITLKSMGYNFLIKLLVSVAKEHKFFVKLQLSNRKLRVSLPTTENRYKLLVLSLSCCLHAVYAFIYCATFNVILRFLLMMKNSKKASLVRDTSTLHSLDAFIENVYIYFFTQQKHAISLHTFYY